MMNKEQLVWYVQQSLLYTSVVLSGHWLIFGFNEYLLSTLIAFLMIRIFVGIHIYLYYVDETNAYKIHQILGNNAVFNIIGAQPTILMQVADAAGARGLLMHGMGLFDKPVKRLVHTMEFLRAVTTPHLDALETERKESDQLRRVLRYYHGVHAKMQPQIIDGLSYGFSKMNRFWVWCTIIYAELPPVNYFTYPVHEKAKENVYQRMVVIGKKFLETEECYPPTYPEFLVMMEEKLKELEPTPDSLRLTREMLYPTKGPLSFRITSRINAPLAKRIIPKHIRDHYNLQANIFEKAFGLVHTMIIRMVLPLLPQSAMDLDNLLTLMRKLEPGVGTILTYGKKAEIRAKRG